MSVKRQATTELNHENWDQDDPVEQEEEGGFKIASKDILERRVIRTAKRRSQVTSDETKKSVFSGFGGFNKTQPASFDFLSKLTNGNNENNSATSKADSVVASSLFTTKPLTTTPSTGLFSQHTSNTTPTRSPFGSPSTSTGVGTLFGVSSVNATTAPNMFITTKTDTTVGDSTFKTPTATSSTDDTDSTSASLIKFDSIPTTSTTSLPTSPQYPPQLISNTMQSYYVDKIKTTSGDDADESKEKYYSKLTGLNMCVSDWIQKHVEQTPLCILSPIFKDYEKYLKDIQLEYQLAEKEIKKNKEAMNTCEQSTIVKTVSTITTTNGLTCPSNSSTYFSSQTKNAEEINSQPKFSFGMNASTSTNTATFSLTGSRVVTTASQVPSTKSPFLFSLNSGTVQTNESGVPFSFGNGKSFSFSSSVKQNTEVSEGTTKDEDDDTPPKVEYTPLVEENSVYDKKCKIFVKKDGNFVDKGIGTLYIKKIPESGKHQLLVRANTNLGTILVNLILVSAIPTQRMGKNNVMMVCIPTPDTKPPPTPILIRVKTSDEADELLATLDKYKI